jgi:AraC-like DNA-binding protein
VFEQAPTLGEALVEVSLLLPLTSDSLRLVLNVNGPRTTFELVVDQPKLLHPRSAEHIVSMVGFAVRSRLPRDGEFGLTAHWAHPRPESEVDHERVLGMAVRFDAGWNGLSFATEALRVRRGTAGADLDEWVRRADRRRRDQQSPGLVVHVRELIAAELGAHRPVTEVAVAGQLGLHPKSLSRRLSARGTSFRQLVEEVRFDRSRRLLERGLPVDDVATRVGYSDASAFSRAFKRWTGSTPRAYAAEARAGKPSGAAKTG